MAEPAFGGFPAATFEFLDGIAAHNEKTWFDAHRSVYERGYVEAGRAFVAAIGPRLATLSPGVKFDPKINGSIGRINRDIRFSKNKQPYKTHLALWFWHGDRRGWDRPGFYLHIGQDRMFLGCGMHGLEGEILDSFRQSVIHPRSAKALLAAVAAMRQHSAVREGLGDDFVMVYCENRRQDHLDFMNSISSREYRWFL